MLGHPAEIREMFHKVVKTFRRKGAISSEKAVSIKELDLPTNLQEIITGPPRFMGVFVEVNDKYYLSEERLEEFKEQLKGSRRRFKRLLRHTASVPKGFLRFYILKLFKEKPMSGSEIMEEIERQTDRRWKPSPGSVYPLLAWLRDNGYTKEVSTEESGIKRYTLTERGEQFFEEQNFKKIQKKIELSQPFFFNGFWLSPHSEKIKEIRKPIRDFFAAAFNLRIALRENLTEQAIKEVGEFLSETTGRIEELSERIKKGR